MSIKVNLKGFVSWHYGTTTGAVEQMMTELQEVIDRYGDTRDLQVEDMDFGRTTYRYPGFPYEPEPDWRGWT